MSSNLNSRSNIHKQMIHSFLVLDDIEKLIQTERNETIIPLTYIAVMALAYYDPNAEIMGSVKLKIWHHQNVIDGMEAFAINVGFLAGVDFISFIINGFIVWKFCNVNPMKVLHKIQKRYWFVMMTLEAYTLGTVSYSDILESSTFRAFH